MQNLEWNVQYSVGVPKLDQQHIYLFALASRISRHIGKPGDETVFRDAIRDLQEYARTHFEYEELLMQKANFAEFEEHRKLHQIMRTRLELFTAQLQQGFFNRTEFAEFMEKWLTVHILHEDMKYIPSMLAARISDD